MIGAPGRYPCSAEHFPPVDQAVGGWVPDPTEDRGSNITRGEKRGTTFTFSFHCHHEAHVAEERGNNEHGNVKPIGILKIFISLLLGFSVFVRPGQTQGGQ